MIPDDSTPKLWEVLQKSVTYLMASSIFDTPKYSKSLESRAYHEGRGILKRYYQGGILVVAADTHPGIFAYALSKVQTGEDFIFRSINVVGSRPKPKIYLVESKDQNLMIGNLKAKDKFPSFGGSLERYLFEVIGEAFVAVGFLVEKGPPDRYHRRLVI